MWYQLCQEKCIKFYKSKFKSKKPKEKTLQQSTIQYLKDLSKNNNKTWFDANRNKYETARENFIELVEEILKHLIKKDARYADLKAKDCLFRINRDVRFSKDKTPYKKNFSAYFNAEGKKSFKAGYYLHLEPGASFLAAGIWHPEADSLKKIRQEIDYNFDAFKKILNNKKFRETFGGLSTTEDAVLQREPKGYDKENPAIEFLKYKSFVVTQAINEKEFLEKNIIKAITTAFDVATPFVTFLDEAVAE